MKQTLQKKSFNKNVDKIKQANHAFTEFINGLNDRHTFNHSKEETTNLKLLEEHLINMNVLFNDIQKNI